jgi:predicted peptidase
MKPILPFLCTVLALIHTVLPARAQKPQLDPATLLTGEWVLSEYRGLPFAIYGAKDLDAAKKHPLILALHGKSDSNTNGPQVGGWMKSFAKPERYAKNQCIIVAPLCYQPFGATGGGWSAKPGDQAIDLVKALGKALPAVDAKRVYVIGYSMGGFGACHLVVRAPQMFAAAVPVAGYGTGIGAAAGQRTPMRLFHAADDTVVGVAGSRAFAKASSRAKTFHYTEYPTGGHGIGGQVFEDDKLHEWLFAQARR